MSATCATCTQLHDNFACMFHILVHMLFQSLANVEAFIDFEEEDNIEHNVMSQGN